MPHITNTSSNDTNSDIIKAIEYLRLAELKINDINISTVLYMLYLNDNEDIINIVNHKGAFYECRAELIKANSLEGV